MRLLVAVPDLCFEGNCKTYQASVVSHVIAKKKHRPALFDVNALKCLCTYHPQTMHISLVLSPNESKMEMLLLDIVYAPSIVQLKALV